MPAYFHLDMMFTRKRLKPGFIKDIYQQFINASFDFIGGLRREQYKGIRYETTIEEISNWNQSHLEERVISDFPDEKNIYDGDYGYKDECRQIFFKMEGYSELRGYWNDYNNHLRFCLIVPEDDVLFIEKGVRYIQNKLMPFINISKNLWECGKVDLVQTHLQEDDFYGFSQILKGENISVRPFAVLPESAYKIFPKDYFAKMQTLKLTNNGIYIEQTDSMVCK